MVGPSPIAASDASRDGYNVQVAETALTPDDPPGVPTDAAITAVVTQPAIASPAHAGRRWRRSKRHARCPRTTLPTLVLELFAAGSSTSSGDAHAGRWRNLPLIDIQWFSADSNYHRPDPAGPQYSYPMLDSRRITVLLATTVSPRDSHPQTPFSRPARCGRSNAPRGAPRATWPPMPAS